MALRYEGTTIARSAQPPTRCSTRLGRPSSPSSRLVQNGVEWLCLAVETLGALIIAGGMVVAIAGLVRYAIAARHAGHRSFVPIRLSFPRYLTLALELPNLP